MKITLDSTDKADLELIKQLLGFCQGRVCECESEPKRELKNTKPLRVLTPEECDTKKLGLKAGKLALQAEQAQVIAGQASKAALTDDEAGYRQALLKQLQGVAQQPTLEQAQTELKHAQVIAEQANKLVPPRSLTPQEHEMIEEQEQSSKLDQPPQAELVKKDEAYYEHLTSQTVSEIIGAISSGAPNLTEIRILCNRAATSLGESGVPTVMKVIESLGVRNLTELPEADYGKIIEAIKDLWGRK